MNRIRLGELLLEGGQLKPTDLDSALEFQRGHGGKVGAILLRMGAVTTDVLYSALSRQLGYPLFDAGELSAEALDEGLAALQPLRSWLIEHEVLAWRRPDGTLAVAAADPLDADLREPLAAHAEGQAAVWFLVPPQEAERWLRALREGTGSAMALDSQALRELAEDAPVIAYVNNMIAQAVEARASDIHIEPGEREFEVRLRIDGVLHTRASAPMSRYPATASRIKLIAHLDIGERRLPQDGRISVRAAGEELDVRVSSIPAVFGESLVMRLLPKRRADLSLERLGMDAGQLAQFRQWLAQPNGLVLVTGPTGSGKSTTLYSALAAINDQSRKIVTVEDPVEFRLPHLIQIQTQAEIGYTFARALRAILRHDPDIIMIGEIRDRETAEIAIQSALTGHLVLATLHTNDALSAVTRLTDMGVEPYLVAASLRAVMAQRLVRRLCERCGTELADVAPRLQARWRELNGGPHATARWRKAVGCEACQGTGFRGRVGIYELIGVAEGLQHAIAGARPMDELRSLASSAGWRSLRDDGTLKAGQGLTTFEEVLRATSGAGLDD